MSRRPSTVAFWISFLCSFSVYALTLPPHLTPGVSGTYATGAFYAGVASPPGYPIWTLYAHAFTLLVPLGNMAWRVALSSAFAGALTCGLLGYSICRLGDALFDSFPPAKRLSRVDEQRLKIVCACVGASALAFSSPFWKISISHEPNAFGMLLFSGACAILQQWFFGAGHFRVLLLSVFVYGLAVVNTLWLFVAAPGLLLIVALRNAPLARSFAFMIAMALGAATAGDWFVSGLVERGSFVPEPIVDLAQLHNLSTVYFLSTVYAGVLCLILWMRIWSLCGGWRKALLLCAAFVLPFLSFFYLAITSMTNPPANIGYARELAGFAHLIGRGQFEKVMSVYGLGTYCQQIGMLAPPFLKGYGWLFGLPAVLCLGCYGCLSDRVRRWLLGSLATFVCLTFLFLALLDPPADSGVRYTLAMFASPAYLLAAAWTGLGLMLVAAWIARKGCAEHATGSEPGGHSVQQKD